MFPQKSPLFHHNRRTTAERFSPLRPRRHRCRFWRHQVRGLWHARCCQWCPYFELYVHIYSYVHIYVYTYKYVYINTYMYTNMLLPVVPLLRAACTHILIFSCVYIYVYTYKHVYINICMYTHIHEYIVFIAVSFWDAWPAYIREFRALLIECMALLMEWRALLIESRAY